MADMSDQSQQPSRQPAKQALASAHKFDLGVIGAGAVAFLGSLLPFYTVSFETLGLSSDASYNAWHGFFGWFAVLAALAGSGLVLAHLLGVGGKLPIAARTGALIAYAVAVAAMVVALFVHPSGSCDDVEGVGANVCDSIDLGRGFGFWLTLLAVLAGLVLAWLRRGEDAAGHA